MQTWMNTYGNVRRRSNVSPIEFFKQVVTPEDSTGSGTPLRMGWMARATKVTLCVATAFLCYAMIAKLQ